MTSHNNVFRVISIVLSLLLVFGVFSTVVFADDEAEVIVSKKDLGAKYGDIVPTDKNLKAYKNSYSFYGDSTYLYFMVFSEGKSTANCSVEIYSKPDCNENSLVTGYSNSLGKAGTRSLSINWNFKKIHSGKYYGKSYIYTEANGKKVIDSSTVRTFTVNINRIGKQTVTLTSVKNTDGGVTVSWNKISIATKYYVYRKLSGDKSWTKLATLSSSSLSYKDTTVKSGKTYIYTVKAADGTFNSLYNKTGLSVLYLAQPVLKSADGYGASGIAKITWDKVSGAKGYYVYRKGGSLNNTSWTKIATVSAGTSYYVDKNSKSTNWKYVYTVKAYNGKSASSHNATGIEFNYLKAPAITAFTLTTAGVKVSFKDSNILKYKYSVYRKAPGDTSWTKLGTTSALSFTDTTAKSGVTYTYTVRSVYKTNGGAYSSAGKSTLFLASPVPSVSESENGAMTVKWNAVSGAKGYYVYRKTVSTGWTRIKEITNGKTVSYVDKAAKTSGETYTYTVRAINGSVASSFYTDKATSLYLKAPAISAKNTKDGIEITLNKVTGAKSYLLYKKAGDGEWSLTEELKDTTAFVDEDIVSGICYTYKAVAVSGNYKSKGSSVTIYGVGIPVVTDAVVTEEGVKVIWEAVDGADTYYIYRKSANTDWTPIGSYSLNEFTDTSAEALTEDFSYTVSAAIGTDKGVYDETGIKDFTAKPDVTGTLEFRGEGETEPVITVTWNNDFEIDSYKLYRKASNEEEAVLLTTLTKENIRHQIEEDITYDESFVYEDTELTQGVTYTYTVQPVKEGKLVYEAQTESLKWKFPNIEAVVLNDLTYTEGSPATEETEAVPAGIIVSWLPAEFAESYEILRKCGDEEFSVIATVLYSEDAREYTYCDSTVLRDTEYTYTVKGVKDDRDSDFDTTGKTAILHTPAEGVTPSLQLVDGEDGTKDIAVTWENVTDAVSYQLLMQVNDGEWNTLDVFLFPNENTYVYKNIESEVKYSFKVIATVLDRSVNQKEAESVVWKLPIEPVEFTVTPEREIPATEETEAVPAGITVSWTATEYASSYEILRKCGDEEFAIIATVPYEELKENYSYKDTAVELDTEYTYTVKGVDEGRETSFDTVGKICVIYSPLEGVAPALQLTDGENPETKNIEVVWDEVENATGYTVFRSIDGAEWENVSSVLSTDERIYTENNITANLRYTYKITVLSENRTVNQNETGASIVWVVEEEN